MLFKEAVDNIAAYEGQSDSTKNKLRIRRDLSIARGEILRREITKRRTVPHMHAHTLERLALVEDTLSLSPGSTQKVYRTVEQIPKPIMYQDDAPGFISVSGTDGQSLHSFITPERLAYRTTKFSKSQYYFYANGYLYFFDNIKYVSVRAVFADLLTVGRIKNANGVPCIPVLEIPDDLFHAMKKLYFETNRKDYEPEIQIDEARPKEGI